MTRPWSRAAAAVSAAAIAATVLLLAAGAGCSVSRTTAGAGVPAHATASIEPGHTTEHEVLQRLGPPLAIARDLGRTFYVYEFEREDEGVLSVTYYATIFEYGQSERLKERIVVEIGRDGIVRTVGIQREIDGEEEARQAPPDEEAEEADSEAGGEAGRLGGEGRPATTPPEGDAP